MDCGTGGEDGTGVCTGVGTEVGTGVGTCGVTDVDGTGGVTDIDVGVTLTIF